ncbi:MAG: FUSC family protein [Acetobacteraceae bacterium]
MTMGAFHAGSPRPRSETFYVLRRLAAGLRAAGPALLHGLRLWASVCLALYLAFRLEIGTPYLAGVTAIIVCLPSIGASLRRSWFRLIGALIGSVAIVVLTACVPQDRTLFLIGLALWGAACAFVGSVLRNFAGYAALVSGFSAALIANDQLGATGGANGDAFMLAVNFFTLVALGIFAAGIVLGLTDLGSAPRRLAAHLAGIIAGIAANFTRTLASVGVERPDMQPLRRDFIRRVAALDPMIEESLGQSSQVRHYSPVLQKAVDGFFTALAGWRAVEIRLARMRDEEARQQATVILQTLPPELTGANPDRWTADPIGLYRICETAIRALVALPAGTPSLRALADGAAEALAGLSHAVNGLALLLADPARPVSRRGIARLRVPDWLPALVNAGRAFTAIAAVMLLWIITAWPSGALAIALTSIVALLLAPLADFSYVAAKGFAIGCFLGGICAAIVSFAVLPAFPSQGFAVLCIALALVLVPTGALLTQPWQQAMFTAVAIEFLLMLGPSNPMSYDPARFYNTASAIVAGSTAAALSFLLLPPLSPAFRMRRLLALSLCDLRRLARGGTPTHWEDHIYGRLAAMPNQATPLQRAQLLAALSVGTDILELRRIMHALGLAAGLAPALVATAESHSVAAAAHLTQFDAVLATEPQTQTILRARGRLIRISEALTEHAAYFDAPP